MPLRDIGRRSRLARLDPHGNWRAAVLLGLITSTYSTIFVSLASEQVGRSVAVDWMVVGTVILRDAAIEAPPTWAGIAAGILVHQSADISWAIIFFGLLGRWTRQLGVLALGLLALPWAAFSSAVEYFVLLPWLQPWLRIEQPYWVAFTVHAISATGYLLFPWVHAKVLGHPRTGSWFGPWWVGGMGFGLALAATAFIVTRAGLTPRWPGLEPPVREAQDNFLRKMTVHHELGVRLSNLAMQKATDPNLQVLAELMRAAQKGEVEAMRLWWQGWHGFPMPGITMDERDAMPGMPPRGAIEALDELEGCAFDQEFRPLMIFHHEGAITMAELIQPIARDPRVKLLADAIIHAQERQVELMRQMQCPVVTERNP